MPTTEDSRRSPLLYVLAPEPPASSGIALRGQAIL
jgi:hypothetical protein